MKKIWISSGVLRTISRYTRAVLLPTKESDNWSRAVTRPMTKAKTRLTADICRVTSQSLQQQTGMKAVGVKGKNVAGNLVPLPVASRSS